MSLASETNRFNPVHRKNDFGAGIPVRRSDADHRLSSVLRIQARVISALMVRDMRTRFGGSHLGFLITFLWPLTHAAVVLSFYTVLNRPPSFGTDTFIWVFSGIIPFVSFIYPFRVLSRSLADGVSLTSFPLVKSTDHIFARGAIESLNAMAVFLTATVVLSVYEPHFQVYDFFLCISAVVESAFIGLSFGLLFAAVQRHVPQIQPLMIFINIGVWASMGLFFLPDSIPHPFREYLALNPIMHMGEKFRMGLFAGYTSETFDPTYPLAFGLVCLVLGLGLERFTRT